MLIMEDSYENFLSQWEMGDDDFFNQSHMIHFNEEVFVSVHQPVLYGESDRPSPNPSSSSLQSNNNLKPHSSFPTGCVLSFVNCGVEPACTSTTRVHILAERKRREELTKSIIELSATIPGLKKINKANVLSEAIKYVKQLQKRVKELENQKRKECVDSILVMKKVLHCTNENATLGWVEELPEVKVTVLEKEVLIGILCVKQNKCFHKMLSLLNNLHLSVSSTSILPFGASTVKITVIAKMHDEYNLTIDDLVKALQQCILNLK